MSFTETEQLNHLLEKSRHVLLVLAPTKCGFSLERWPGKIPGENIVDSLLIIVVPKISASSKPEEIQAQISFAKIHSQS